MLDKITDFLVAYGIVITAIGGMIGILIALKNKILKITIFCSTIILSILIVLNIHIETLLNARIELYKFLTLLSTISIIILSTLIFLMNVRRTNINFVN